MENSKEKGLDTSDEESRKEQTGRKSVEERLRESDNRERRQQIQRLLRTGRGTSLNRGERIGTMEELREDFRRELRARDERLEETVEKMRQLLEGRREGKRLVKRRRDSRSSASSDPYTTDTGESESDMGWDSYDLRRSGTATNLTKSDRRVGREAGVARESRRETDERKTAHTAKSKKDMTVNSVSTGTNVKSLNPPPPLIPNPHAGPSCGHASHFTAPMPAPYPKATTIDGESLLMGLEGGEELQVAGQEEVTPILRKEGRAFSEFLTAMKLSNQLVKTTPTPSNIHGWLQQFYDCLSTTFPALKESEKCTLAINRFPTDISEHMSAAKIVTKTELFETAITLFSQGNADVVDSLGRFFECTPKKGSSLLTFVNQLQALVSTLNVSEEKRPVVVLKRIKHFLPPFHQEVVSQRISNSTLIGEKITVVNILRPIFESKETLIEVEKSFSTIARVNQVTEMSQGKKNPRIPFRKRCAKCAGFNHTTENCPLYKTEAKTGCQNCEELMGYTNHYHLPTECLYRPKN